MVSQSLLPFTEIQPAEIRSCLVYDADYLVIIEDMKKRAGYLMLIRDHSMGIECLFVSVDPDDLSDPGRYEFNPIFIPPGLFNDPDNLSHRIATVTALPA